jgi:hypothetical protein
MSQIENKIHDKWPLIYYQCLLFATSIYDASAIENPYEKQLLGCYALPRIGIINLFFSHTIKLSVLNQ